VNTIQMRQLSKLQSILFMLGGLLMVVGAGCYVFMFAQPVVCWVFLLGTILFAAMQCMQSYEGTDMTVRRLKRIMTLADLFFVLAGLLMVDTTYQFLRDAFNNVIDYYQMVYNKWVVLLLIAVALEVYTTHRISHMLGKQQDNDR